MDVILQILNAGGRFSEFVFGVAQHLTDDEAPGLLSLAILGFLGGALVELTISSRRRMAALKRLLRIIREAGKGKEFAEADRRLGRLANSFAGSGDRSRRSVGAAWREFRETVVEDGDEEGTTTLRNSVRPSSFFNAEDLNFGAGFRRNLPGLFVTVGLFLTFLGLIAALQAVNIRPDAGNLEMREALNALLGAAKAKFTMSLTGLLSSIVFTIALRSSLGRMERHIHGICAAIEERLSFISPEDLALRHLRSAERREKQMASIGQELVEKLGEPLRNELPAAVAESLGASLAPIFDRVSKIGVEGAGEVVSGLSARISGDVERALGAASASLSAAGDRIEAIVGRIDGSPGNGSALGISEAAKRMTEAAESIVAKLDRSTEETAAASGDDFGRLLEKINAALDGILRNTGDGAAAMRDAAAEMKANAATFRERLDDAAKGAEAVRDSARLAVDEAGQAISGAGQAMIETLSRSGSAILDASSQFSEKVRAEIVAPLDLVADRMERLRAGMESGADRFERATGDLDRIGEASRSAAGALASATRDLAEAAEPLRSGVEGISRSVESLERSTGQAGEAVAAGARETAATAARNLEIAHEMLGGERKAVEAVLAGLKAALERMEAQGERPDDMDEKLGGAFRQFAEQVEKAIGSLADHVGKMNGEIAPAIDKMHEIVDRAERFVPKTRNS